MTGVVFGLVLAVLGRRRPGNLVSFGALGGLLLFLALMLIEISLGFSAAGLLASAIWLGVVLLG
jgi:hypothetical protein